MVSSINGWRAITCALGMLGAFLPQVAAAMPGGSEKPEALATDARSKAVLEIVKRFDDFTGITGLDLAPGGAHAIMIGWTGAARRLLLMDTATLATLRIKASDNLSDADADNIWPVSARWIDSERLIVDWSDNRSVVTALDGRNIRTVGTHVIRLMRKPDGSYDDWAVVGDAGLFHGHDIHRVNLRTGEESTVPVGLPGEIVRVNFDRRGELRVVVMRDGAWAAKGTKTSTWYRHDEKSPWQLLQERLAVNYEDNWFVGGVLDDDQLLVTSREGRDTWAMFLYDAKTRKLGDMVAGHPTEDLVCTDDYDDMDDLPSRVKSMGLKPTMWWFDPDWDRLQRAVDAALPSTINDIRGDPKGFVLVYSQSDREPGVWRLLDTAHMKMRQLARRQLSVDAAQMRPKQTLTYAADDGLKVPAYLTLPAGPEQPRPMVVLIHDGPVWRDYWDFDYQVQTLAAAGYAVFQPQFRGSTGFGRAFEMDGFHQWGLAMQDDITAGVKAMIARGVADPRRICIVGRSYGGYAAMWGLEKTPELYQCGVTVSGVSDINEMFADASDPNDEVRLFALMRFRTVDVAGMKSQFAEVSPTKHADRVSVPVLIAHGGADKVVPIDHAKRLQRALKNANKSVEVQWYPMDGHGFQYEDDRQHFAMLTIGFLDRHIGPASSWAKRWVPVPAPAASQAAPAR